VPRSQYVGVTHLHRLSPSKLRQREYERPDCWERQIEGLYERALAAGTDLLAPYMATDAARAVLGSIAIDLFVRGVRVVGPPSAPPQRDAKLEGIPKSAS
jgi:hypothetical protein